MQCLVMRLLEQLDVDLWAFEDMSLGEIPSAKNVRNEAAGDNAVQDGQRGTRSLNNGETHLIQFMFSRVTGYDVGMQ